MNKHIYSLKKMSNCQQHMVINDNPFCVKVHIIHWVVPVPVWQRNVMQNSLVTFYSVLKIMVTVLICDSHVSD